jgi:hypothetical protein
MDAMDQLRVGIAQNHGLPPTLAHRIEGQSIEELVAAAEAVATSHPNPAELASFNAAAQKQERDLSLLQMLHGSFEVPDPQPSEAPDFDGGVREPAPLPSDPVRDHDELLLAWVRESHLGGGGGW